MKQPERKKPGRRPAEQTKIETKLARWRVERKVTQEEMAEAAGISLSAYWRLERARDDNPPLRVLINCALALGVELDELIEDEWRRWRPTERYARPPAPSRFWRADRAT